MILEDFLRYVGEGMIPPDYPDPPMSECDLPGFFSYYEYIAARKKCTDEGMFALVTQQWTKQLADWVNGRRVLEIMSGRGWLAKALKDHGVDILATDNHTSHSRWMKGNKAHTLLTDISVLESSEAIRRYRDEFDILLCSWPPMETSMTKAIRRWGTNKPIVYIGEGDHGCTADRTFWSWFDGEISDDIELPRWKGIYDYVYIGRCRKEAIRDTYLLDL